MFKQEFLLHDMIVRELVQKENKCYFTFSRFFNDLIQQSFKVQKNDAWSTGFNKYMSKTMEFLGLIKEVKEITK
jgi:hypothetical protein